MLSLHLTQRKRSTYVLLVAATRVYEDNDNWKERTFRWMAIALSRDPTARFTVVLSKIDELKGLNDIETSLLKLKVALVDFVKAWKIFIVNAISDLDDETGNKLKGSVMEAKWWEGDECEPIATSAKSLVGMNKVKSECMKVLRSIQYFRT